MPSSRSGWTDPARAPVLRLHRVRASYSRFLRRRVALQDVELTAEPGRITAVVGPNGSGKTTLLRLLLGFLVPDAGEVRVGDLPPASYRRRHGVGYLPENPVVPLGWRVDAFFRRGAELAGLHHRDQARAMARAWERSSLDPAALGGQRLDRLSRGTQRRALLAFALIGEPAVVLLDEPFSGLDPEARVRLRDGAARLRDEGRTVLLVSHDLAEVERLADHVVLLVAGRVIRTLEGAALRSSRRLRLAIRGADNAVAALLLANLLRPLPDGRFELVRHEEFDAVARAVYEDGGRIEGLDPANRSALEDLLLEDNHGTSPP